MDENIHAKEKFYESLLQPGEIVLWHGAPGPGRLRAYGQIPIGFSVFWLGFCLLWEVIALFNGIIIMALFGIPFVVVGVSIAFGGPIRQAKLKGKIFYAVTDQRLLILEGDDISEYTPDILPPLQLHMNKNGTGSIFFEETYYSGRHGTQYHCLCSLENLTDVGRAQSALTSMMSRE